MLDVNRSSLLLWPVKEDMISAEKSSNRWEACAAAKRPDGEGTRAHAVRLRSGGQQWSAVSDGGYVLRSTLGAHGDPMIKDPHLAIEEIMTTSPPPGSSVPNPLRPDHPAPSDCEGASLGAGSDFSRRLGS